MEKLEEDIIMLGLSLTICRNKKGQFIAIEETRNRGWWIPGGRVDPPEDFFTAAIRECKEEAGIDIELKGIIQLNYSFSSFDRNQIYLRFKVIFYAEPKDENQPLKTIADKESVQAQWMTIQQFENLNNQRGPELIIYGKYLEKGGIIYPLNILSQHDKVPQYIKPFGGQSIRSLENEVQELEKKKEQLLLTNKIQDTKISNKNQLQQQKPNISKQFCKCIIY